MLTISFTFDKTLPALMLHVMSSTRYVQIWHLKPREQNNKLNFLGSTHHSSPLYQTNDQTYCHTKQLVSSAIKENGNLVSDEEILKIASIL